ncbi:hypothetical protein CXB51_034116 [Gossypium anomalum]|uniref:Uncharacterized protein n=1 Tax=Gossypium anomalum TaxID=47600 RepID=A0A8J6CL61_9ROSI|nr:hypothetical protein CXB51_034116 [Gossypium anomalum]
MENYFCAKGIVDDAGKVNTASLVLTDIALLWWRDRTTDKRQGKVVRDNVMGHCGGVCSRVQGTRTPSFRCDRERSIAWFSKGLKPWVRQEVEQRGVQKLSEAMTVAESVVKLGVGKDKLGSSKSETLGPNSMRRKAQKKIEKYFP